MSESIKKFQYAEKKQKIEKVLNSLVSGDSPRLEVSQLEKAQALLMGSDDVNAVKFSVDGKEVEKTQFALFSEFLGSLPEIQQVHNSKSIVKSEGDLSVSNDDLEDLGSFTSESAESLMKFKKVQANTKVDFSQMSEEEILKVYQNEDVFTNLV
jgi:hypothetical protein